MAKLKNDTPVYTIDGVKYALINGSMVPVVTPVKTDVKHDTATKANNTSNVYSISVSVRGNGFYKSLPMLKTEENAIKVFNLYKSFNEYKHIKLEQAIVTQGVKLTQGDFITLKDFTFKPLKNS